MKTFLCFVLALSCVAGQAQINATCQPLIDAEHAFVAMAKDKNTRDAFLAFLSDRAITFDNNGHRVGKDHLKIQEPNETLLSWRPCYSDMSLSGDWGYNIGPWDYRPNKNDKEPVAFGHFATVWVKESDGEWRALVDIGVSHDRQETSDVLVSSKIVSSPIAKSDKSGLSIEQEFLRLFEHGVKDAYARSISTEARILRNGVAPFETNATILAHVSQSQKVVYHPVAGEFSPARDMLFVFGTAQVESTNAGKTETQQKNYLRIWKNEDGKGWRIVIDVLS